MIVELAQNQIPDDNMLQKELTDIEMMGMEVVFNKYFGDYNENLLTVKNEVQILYPEGNLKYKDKSVVELMLTKDHTVIMVTCSGEDCEDEHYYRLN